MYPITGVMTTFLVLIWCVRFGCSFFCVCVYGGGGFLTDGIFLAPYVSDAKVGFPWS